MSVLIMMLAAGTIMRTGLDDISSKTDEHPCLESTWEGTCQGWPGAKGEVLQVRLEPGSLVLFQGKDGIAYHWEWVDEGKGKLKVKGIQGQISAVGIYKWEKGCLVICFRDVKERRPTRFYAGEGRVLLVLRPVKKSR